MTPTGRIAGGVPLALETWGASVIVLAWIVVLLVIGYYRFERGHQPRDRSLHLFGQTDNCCSVRISP